MPPKYRIKKQQIVHHGPLQVEEGIIELHTEDNGTIEYARQRVKRTDAVAVLLHNTEKNTVVMIRQFRYAVHDRISDRLLEIPAGKMDAGENPEETAVRETFEECGIKLSVNRLHLLASFFASPGYTEEKYFIYYAGFTQKDMTGKGGGLEEENEYIELTEFPVRTFYSMLSENRIEDGKTITAGLLARQKGFIKD